MLLIFEKRTIKLIDYIVRFYLISNYYKVAKVTFNPEKDKKTDL